MDLGSYVFLLRNGVDVVCGWTVDNRTLRTSIDCGDIDVKIKEKEQGTVTTSLSNSYSSQRRDNRFTELALKLKIRDKP